MSKALDAMERHVHLREHGTPLSEIIQKCDEYVKEREIREARMEAIRIGRVKEYNLSRKFSVREGRTLERIKLI